MSERKQGIRLCKERASKRVQTSLQLYLRDNNYNNGICAVAMQHNRTREHYTAYITRARRLGDTNTGREVTREITHYSVNTNRTRP